MPVKQQAADSFSTFAANKYIFSNRFFNGNQLYHMLSGKTKLRIIKIVHTLVWIFFNVVIFYMLYAAIANKIDKWLWIGYGLFVLEGFVLLCFKFFCPLTVLARKYSDSERHNFDIYLPEWLAKHNKLIYTSLLGCITLITVYQLVR